MAEQDEPDLLRGGVGGILEGIGGKLPEANFDLDCSDEVRSRCKKSNVKTVWIASPLLQVYCIVLLLPTCSD